MGKETEAYSLAAAARENAHAPYSHYKVGCALKLVGDDRVFTGCNVENASYGATICAERTAILKAISESSSRKLEYMVLITDSDPVAPPCGECLQVISEFGDGSLPIHLANLGGIQKSVTLDELMPMRFEFE